jgi:outer membrane lipoprotein-sorting protein
VKPTVIWVLLGALAAARAESLDAIFARMDEASKKLKFVTANLHQTDYMAVIDEKTEEDGKLRMKRGKNGMSLLVQFNPPNERTVALDGRTLWIYLPKGNQAEKYDVTKYTSTNTVEQLLLLSFGAASGAELQKNYTVTTDGTETIDSRVTTRVVLVPKSAEMRKEILRITLWIPEGQSSAVKEKVDKAGKNYLVYAYSGVDMKTPVSDAEVSLKLPKNVHVVGAK